LYADVTGNSGYGFRDVDHIKVQFVTDDSGTYYGFSVLYDCKPTRCGSSNYTYSGYNYWPGNILSDPDSYGGTYLSDNNMDCIYSIECPQQGGMVRIQNLLVSTYDSNDWVKLIDTYGTVKDFVYSPTAFTLRGSSSITYATNRMEVWYHTDGSGQSYGLYFQYDCYCGSVYSECPAQTKPVTGLCSLAESQCATIGQTCSTISAKCTNPNDSCYQVLVGCQTVLTKCNAAAVECRTQSNVFCPTSLLLN